MPSSDSAGEPKPTCIITMVHGTWGNGFFPKKHRPQHRSWVRQLIGRSPRRWFDETSPFRKALESELEKENVSATFRPFLWSGANSVCARARAADELAKLIGSDPEQTRSVVIAHSHGGNVAFRAISKLGTRGSKIHLITLATPFLRVFPTKFGLGFGDAGVVFGLAIAAGLVLLLWSQLERTDTTLPLLIYAVIFAVSAIASKLLVWLIINPWPKMQSDRQAKPWPRRPFDIAERVNYETTGPLAPKVLVIRGVDDEAALVLAFGAIATALNRFVLRAMWKWLYPGISLLVILTLGLSYLLRLDPSLTIRVAVVSWCVLMFGTSILLILPGLFNARFGKEFSIGAMRCEIATDSTPDSTQVQIVTLEPTYRELMPQGQKNDTARNSSMRHKIYDHPDCPREIVKWITEHIHRPPPSR